MQVARELCYVTTLREGKDGQGKGIVDVTVDTQPPMIIRLRRGGWDRIIHQGDLLIVTVIDGSVTRVSQVLSAPHVILGSMMEGTIA